VEWVDEVVRSVQPSASLPDLSWRTLLIVGALALVLVTVRPLWRVVRLGVTLVHELGHAFTGILCGRRFTGFVLRPDMSGHAVTAGRPRGAGLALTTWAGYPAPAVVALGAVVAVGQGLAAPVVTVALLALVVALPRIRSVLTAAVVVAVAAGLGGLWWWRDDTLQAGVLLGAALVLLVGAWRHILTVAGVRDLRSDPAVLTALTRVPRLVWVATYLAVAAGATYGAAWSLRLVPGPG